MSLILNIETATTVCSVSVFKENQMLALMELDAGYTHAENLHIFIRDVLSEAKIKIAELDAIAVSKGPGSYTGLRIGVSAAKGLAYALHVPLISVETLQVMSHAALEIDPDVTFFCPMIDARRMEVYTAIFDRKLAPCENTNALIVDEESIKQFGKYKNICFFGDGMNKCKPLFSESQKVLDGIYPSARNMGSLTYAKFLAAEFEDAAYFEPFYLKEFLAGKKKALNS